MTQRVFCYYITPLTGSVQWARTPSTLTRCSRCAVMHRQSESRCRRGRKHSPVRSRQVSLQPQTDGYSFQGFLAFETADKGLRTRSEFKGTLKTCVALMPTCLPHSLSLLPIHRSAPEHPGQQYPLNFLKNNLQPASKSSDTDCSLTLLAAQCHPHQAFPTRDLKRQQSHFSVGGAFRKTMEKARCEQTNFIL